MNFLQRVAVFFVTYGWAIVILVIAVSLISYFNVFTPESVVLESCSFGFGMKCVEEPVVNFVTGETRLRLRNKIGYPIHTLSWSRGTGDCSLQSGFKVVADENASISYTSDAYVLMPEDDVILSFTCGDGSGIIGNLNTEITLTYYNTHDEKIATLLGSMDVLND